MRTFLLVFNLNQISRRAVVGRVDGINAIGDWIAFFDNSLCLATDLSARELTDRLRETMPDVQFIVSEIEAGKRNGWLPKSVWNFLNRPKSANTKVAAE